MVPFIQNVPLKAVAQGFHYDAGINSMLIQIVDPCMEFPVPKHQFREVHRFEFLDEEDTENPFSITPMQAAELVALLQHALENEMNVTVHCVAGLCRSGAVAEVGVMLGFRDAETERLPNTLVKTSMMRVLGWTYD